jgi:gliding motility-associated-like protein
MKVSKFLLLFCLVCLWALTPLHAQNKYCRNLSFELGNFTNWVGYTWRNSIDVPSINTNPVPGIVSRRHTIMSDTSAYDANTGYALKIIPKGYNYCARLGDELFSGDGTGNPRTRCWEQSLRYTMTIDSSNALLIFKFALVLQYAVTHSEINEPRFKLTLYDSKGNVLPDCSNYDVYASNKVVKGFKTFTPASVGGAPVVPVNWRDWTTVGANLMKYIGQTITIEFMAADCREHWHYGYAYFVAECHPLYITVKYCAADTAATLTAPEGFEKYQWTNTTSGAKLDTLQTLYVTVPDQKTSYSCTMTSATGCVVSLNSKIVRYIPKADFNSFMLDCFTNTVQFTNLSTKTNGTLTYDWNFYEGKTSSLKSPPYTFNTSGIHMVTLILSNPPSACKDTLTKNIESFSPPLVGIVGDSTYCPGLSTSISGYGASEYFWSNGSTTDTIEISAPGGKLWLLGYSTTGCVSDTMYRTIIEEPGWKFLKQGDSTFCGKESAILSATGAVSYAWNRRVIITEAGERSYLWTNETTNDSLVASSAGTYIVTGANARGCKKSLIFNVVGYPLPSVDFTLSPDPLNKKHNTLTCTIPDEGDVNYRWNMGDGLSETGSTIKHIYNISDTTLAYKIKLIATTIHTCRDSSSQFVDVVPYVPNVFSPNGDGLNDEFMPGFDLEIVDRNGQKIFKGNTGWDGMQNGEPADPDTYFYLIYYTDSAQKTHSIKGYVTLVR